MALIKCSECGKEISDKAVACPQCGCPVALTVELAIKGHEAVEDAIEAVVSVKQDIDFSKFSKEELYYMTNDYRYNGKKSDEQLAIEIFNYLILNFSNSVEADYASKQLKIMARSSLPEESTYEECSSNKDFSSPSPTDSSELPKRSNSSTHTRNWHPDIPIGLYRAAAIIGCPWGTIIACLAYARQKNLINRGEYDKASKSITRFSVLCWIILIPSTLVVLVLIFVMLVEYGLLGAIIVAAVFGLDWLIFSRVIK